MYPHTVYKYIIFIIHYALSSYSAKLFYRTASLGVVGKYFFCLFLKSLSVISFHKHCAVLVATMIPSLLVLSIPRKLLVFMTLALFV